MSTLTLLERAEALCAKATAGPWQVRVAPNGKPAGIHQPEFECWIPASEEDQHFIAASRTLVPELVSLVRKYQAALERITCKDKWCCNQRIACHIAKAALAQGDGDADA